MSTNSTFDLLPFPEENNLSTFTRVFIYGSHISRDTYEVFPKTDVTLLRYVSRQTLVSALTPPTTPAFDTNILDSLFQRGMIQGDAASDLIPWLRVHQDEIDLIFWDLFDERFGFFVNPDGSVTSRSLEQLSVTNNGHPAKVGRLIDFGTSEHFSYFKQALEAFITAIQPLDVIDKIMLLAPDWASQDILSGQTSDPYFPDVAAINKTYEKYYQLIEELTGIKPLRLRETTANVPAPGQGNSKPTQYSQEVYEALGQQIRTHFDADKDLHTPLDAEALELTRSRRPSVVTTTPVTFAAESVVAPTSTVKVASAPVTAPEQPENKVSTGKPGHPSIRFEQVAPHALEIKVRPTPGIRYSFSLRLDEKEITKTPFSDATSHRFDDLAPGNYRCRVYQLATDGSRSAYSSEAVALTSPEKNRNGYFLETKSADDLMAAYIYRANRAFNALIVSPQQVSTLQNKAVELPVVTAAEVPEQAQVLPAHNLTDATPTQLPNLEFQAALAELLPLQIYRIARLLFRKGYDAQAKYLTEQILQLHKCVIPHTAQIDRGTRLVHGGINVVISGRAIIRKNCVIHQNVTIGEGNRSIEVGENVVIFPGAVLFTSRIADGAQIAPNSVVTD